MAQTYSFEDIDRHINSLKLADYQPGGARHFTAAALTGSPSDVLKSVCGIYRGIRPILVALQAFILIPPNWRSAIQVFMSLMDTLCPGEGN